MTALVLSVGLSVLGAVGCGEPPVGAPCLPEQVPADGFSNSESYIEASSVQCQTRVCMVYRLEGNPDLSTCRQGECVADDPNLAECRQQRCPDLEDVEARVYCTCRCEAPPGFAECECPANFKCQEILQNADEGVNGSYCVRKGT